MSKGIPDPKAGNLGDAALPERAALVRHRLAESCRRAGRSLAEVKLVAVSKTMPDEAVLQAAKSGLSCLGENRPEALAARMASPTLKDLELEWHLIGPLQSRKVRQLPPTVSMIQSVERKKTAEILSGFGNQIGRRIPILIQVNPAKESNKHGVSLTAAEPLAASIAELSGIEIQGLMAMTPLGAGESDLRRYFRDTRVTLEALRSNLPQINWLHLSMGMTQDFEIAIEEGATIARIGSAIFGPRLTV